MIQDNLKININLKMTIPINRIDEIIKRMIIIKAKTLDSILNINKKMIILGMMMNIEGTIIMKIKVSL